MSVGSNFFFKIFLFSIFFIASPVLAADPKPTILDDSYVAKFVSQSVSDPLTIEAGSTKTVTFKFKNTGTATWNEKGNNYISAYAVEPKYRNSDFRSAGWISAKQTGKIKGTVKPNTMGELSVELKAPSKIGEYTEQFYLSSENHTWVKGGYFFLKIKVISPSKKVTQDSVQTEISIKENASSDVSSPSVSAPAPTVSLSPYKAKFLGVSKPKITVRPGEKTEILFMYQNIGKASWATYSFKRNEAVNLALVNSEISFADDSWKSTVLVKTGGIDTPKNGILQKNFILKAPTEPGTYKAAFYLEVDGEKVDGGEAFVDVLVTTDAPQFAESTLHPDPVVPIVSARLPEEPRIRVGLDKVKGNIIFTSDQDEYDVFDGDTSVARLPVSTTATVSYKSGTYSCACNGETFTSNNSFRFVPVNNPHAVFQLKNLERTVPWQKNVNFNTYHGSFELKFPVKGDLPYAINDVLFEDYILGIREVSNGTPMEYMKSQAVLERTYAYYIQQTTKHDDRFFDVVAHTGDQLYLGYESEKLMPRFVEAVESTRGLMVTYDTDQNSTTPSDIVITPYFGNSDGMTRSFRQVWGGKEEKPWLMPVAATYDKKDRKKMYGHGVGMSQRDAMIRADKEGLDYGALIKYYYTGVEIERIY